MAELLQQPKHKPENGFENMGKPVPMFRREAAYTALKEMGVASADERFACIGAMAEALARDEPYNAMAAGMRYVDLTGTYRLMATLLVALQPDPTP